MPIAIMTNDGSAIAAMTVTAYSWQFHDWTSCSQSIMISES